MPYFLDGNNLIERRNPSEEDRQVLVAEIANRLRKTRASAVLFFDGGAHRSYSLGALRIRDGFGANADEDILTGIRQARSAAEVTVVTSDQELARRVRDAGARVVPPGQFWARFGTQTSAGEKETGTVDVGDWERYFADEENRGK